MTETFASLKRNRTSMLETLTQELTKQETKQNQNQDERLWKPTVDKAGNGQATIRFLPPSKGETIPYVRIWDHGFQGPTGGWYIEKSLTSIDKPDPLYELNGRLYRTGIKSDEEQAKLQKRKLSYYSNILVVKDPGNPDNEGKVFLFKYGKKIHDMINRAYKPVDEEDSPIPVFDPWDGADFRLRVRKVDKYPNYDESSFGKPKPIGTDEEIEAIWKSQYSLQELLEPKNFKTYDELKARLDKVLGLTSSTLQSTTHTRSAEDVSPPWDDSPEESTDSISYFKKLAEED